MFSSVIKINRSSDWIKTQLTTLRTTGSALKNLTERQPFVLVKSQSNIFTAICSGLVFIKPGQPQTQTVRIIFLPSILVFLFFIPWLLSVYFSIRSYLITQQIHEIDPTYVVTPFLWARHMPALLILMFMFGPLQKERLYILEQLQKILMNPEN